MTAKFRSKNIASTLVAAVAVFAIVAPCAAQSATASAGVAPRAPPQQRPQPSASGPSPATEYIIGADDVMSVVFWRDKELSADVTVRPDGKISLPLLNEVQAAGLTPGQLKDRIAEEAEEVRRRPERHC